LVFLKITKGDRIVEIKTVQIGKNILKSKDLIKTDTISYIFILNPGFQISFGS
jgi:hypothetical protein